MANMQFHSNRLVATTMAITVAILLMTPIGVVRASDEDPLQDFCIADIHSPITINGFPCKPSGSVVSNDFFSSVLAKPGEPDALFGSMVTMGNVTNYPGINTLGMSMNRVDFAMKGINPPHTHPRATELILVMEGTLRIGIITTDNVYFSQVLTAGMNAVIPRALLHFEENVETTTAYFITVFNSQNPGVLVASTALFGSTPMIPDFVLTKALGGAAQTDVDTIKAQFVGAVLAPSPNPPPPSGNPPPSRTPPDSSSPSPPGPPPPSPPPPSPSPPPPRPPPPAPTQCPANTIQLQVCIAWLSAFSKISIGGFPLPVSSPCCSMLNGFPSIQAAGCVCLAIAKIPSSISAKLLNVNSILNTCGINAPPDFMCPK